MVCVFFRVLRSGIVFFVLWVCRGFGSCPGRGWSHQDGGLVVSVNLLNVLQLLRAKGGGCASLFCRPASGMATPVILFARTNPRPPRVPSATRSAGTSAARLTVSWAYFWGFTCSVTRRALARLRAGALCRTRLLDLHLRLESTSTQAFGAKGSCARACCERGKGDRGRLAPPHYVIL